MMLLLIDEQNKEIYFSRIYLIFLTTFNPELPLLKLGFFVIKTVHVSGSKNTDLEKLKKQFNILS